MKCWSYEKITQTFKVGDKVRLLKREAMNAKVGATGIVYGYTEDTNKFSESCGYFYLNVQWERNGLDGHQTDGGYYPEDFELVLKEIKQCPRCNKKLTRKTINGLLYSDKQEEIEKCFSCGWC